MCLSFPLFFVLQKIMKERSGEPKNNAEDIRHTAKKPILFKQKQTKQERSKSWIYTREQKS